MKRFNIVIILLLSVILIVINGYSQDKPVRFGARLGTSLVFTNADISGLDVKPRFVLNAGAFGEYWFSKVFGLQGNLLYNKKGAQWGESVGGASLDLIWNFDYLSIPIYGKAAFGERTRFYLLFGPEFSFLLSAKQKVETSGIITPYEGETDVKEYVKSFEAAFGFGLGVEIPVSETLLLFIDSRGSVSITEIFEELPPGYIPLADSKGIRNFVSALNIGLIF